MSLNQISTRYSTSLALLQPIGQSDAAKAASNPTGDIIKIANGISTAPGAAAKQASGVAFTFMTGQSLNDEVQKGEDSNSIIMAGIGGGEAVERFNSWEALEVRIRTDGTMDDKQKIEWLNQAAALKTSVLDLKTFQQSDLYISLKSNSLKSELDMAVNSYLAEGKSVASIKESITEEPVKIFLTNTTA